MTMVLSTGSAAPSPTDLFLRAAAPPSLSYPHLRSSMAVRPPFTSSRFSHPDIFEKIICPYNADAFDALLRKHNLSDAYPDLVDNLKYGFPLGDMPVLSRTNILHNHDSIDDHWPLIEQYLLDEIASGRMDGPFSQSEVESILRGPFQSSPLIAVIQPQAPGEPDKVRICRHLSKATKNIPSVNSFINKESFPTRFDTAIKVADIVSSLPLPPYHYPYLLLILFPLRSPKPLQGLRRAPLISRSSTVPALSHPITNHGSLFKAALANSLLTMFTLSVLPQPAAMLA